MKRFRFDLDKLLELRRYREREAELELARAMGEAAAVQYRLLDLARDRAAAAAERFAPGRSVAEIRHTDLYILRLDRTKDALIEAAAKAEAVVDTARDAFTEASRDRKVIDKLKEKRLAEHRAAREDEELKSIDDLTGGAAARRATTG